MSYNITNSEIDRDNNIYFTPRFKQKCGSLLSTSVGSVGEAYEGGELLVDEKMVSFYKNAENWIDDNDLEVSDGKLTGYGQRYAGIDTGTDFLSEDILKKKQLVGVDSYQDKKALLEKSLDKVESNKEIYRVLQDLIKETGIDFTEEQIKVLKDRLQEKLGGNMEIPYNTVEETNNMEMYKKKVRPLNTTLVDDVGEKVPQQEFEADTESRGIKNLADDKEESNMKKESELGRKEQVSFIDRNEKEIGFFSDDKEDEIRKRQEEIIKIKKKQASVDKSLLETDDAYDTWRRFQAVEEYNKKEASESEMVENMSEDELVDLYYSLKGKEKLYAEDIALLLSLEKEMKKRKLLASDISLNTTKEPQRFEEYKKKRVEEKPNISSYKDVSYEMYMGNVEDKEKYHTRTANVARCVIVLEGDIEKIEKVFEEFLNIADNIDILDTDSRNNKVVVQAENIALNQIKDIKEKYPIVKIAVQKYDSVPRGKQIRPSEAYDKDFELFGETGRNLLGYKSEYEKIKLGVCDFCNVKKEVFLVDDLKVCDDCLENF